MLVFVHACAPWPERLSTAHTAAGHKDPRHGAGPCQLAQRELQAIGLRARQAVELEGLEGGVLLRMRTGVLGD
eukprot:917166-Alexandrium_andersonii.AAC.1